MPLVWAAEAWRRAASWPGRIRQFSLDVQAEMKRVTWPTWPELRSATAVVIVFVLIVAAIIAIMDWVFKSVVTGIIHFFTG